VLTNSYVAGNVIGQTSSGVYKIPDLQSFSSMKVIADFTIGSLTDCDIKVEFSNDGTTYWQETFTAVSGDESTASLGHTTIDGDGVYGFDIERLTAAFVKISAVGNGTVTGSSLAIDVILSDRT